MKDLELLAPARNMEIGIAAIDCGADAVYIAGPGFGARKAAGNSLEDIAGLCAYAHRFGARVFLTVNTIIYDDELDTVHSLMLDAQEAGVDAFIVQDLALTQWDDITVPLHASTQCSIRDEHKAGFLESSGFSRIVLERELSLEQIKKICSSVQCEVECFVHGALCVCYSGECYLSEYLSGRSANRGECIQACRSLYDLVNSEGKVLARNKALLSLKDYHLLGRLEELAGAGVSSFKIEGRLKNISYVKNVVRAYSAALDDLVSKHPLEYRRASFGKVTGGFIPDVDKTFNRGYTQLFIDGERGNWSSMDTPKSMGEYIGKVKDLRRTGNGSMEIEIRPDNSSVRLANGDGFSFSTGKGIVGFRGDVCEGNVIACKFIPGLYKGAGLFRNINAAFERELENRTCSREMAVTVDLSVSDGYKLDFTARSEDGRVVLCPFNADLDTAENRERQEAIIRGQLSKHSGIYNFTFGTIEVRTKGGKIPLMSASLLNSIRRLIAEDLDAQPCIKREMGSGRTDPTVNFPSDGKVFADYKENVANGCATHFLESRGLRGAEPAYELSHRAGAELMRTKYCIRFELGMCPVHQNAAQSGDLFLVNNGRRLALGFDCRNCEMTVSAE